MKINVLYVSYNGMTDPLGQSQVLSYLKGLSKKNIKFHLISVEKPKEYKKEVESIRKILNNYDISWYPIKYTKKPPVFSTMYDINKMKKKAIKIQKNNRLDLVHCRGYISSIIGLYLKEKFNLKFIFDMRGFFADERVDGKLWNLTNPIYKIIYEYFKKKEKEFLIKADSVVTLTYRAKNEISLWPEVKSKVSSINVIPCCVDNKLFERKENKETEALKVSLGLQNKFILSYLGSIGTWYMLDEMLDFFVEFNKRVNNAILLFITGSETKQIIIKAREKGIDNSNIFFIKANYIDVPKYLALSEASIFFIKPCYSKMASSPVKQGEIMNMGIPIFCNAGVGDTDELINKYNSGWLVKEFNSKEYNNVIEEFMQNSINVEKTIQGANEYFGLERGVENYYKIYKQLI